MTANRHTGLLGRVCGALVGLLGAGCGSGSVAIGLGSSDDGGSAAPVLTSFDVAGARVPPATLSLGLSRGSVRVRLLYAVGTGALEPMTQVGGGPSGEVMLQAGATQLVWDFDSEPGLLGTRFVGDVRVAVEFPGGTVPEGGTLALGVGNDPPELEAVEGPSTEVSGNVAIDLTLSDSSGDVVTLTPQWRRTGDPPDAWNPATPAGIFPPGVATTPDGVQLSFFWDTSTDLGDEETEVVVRFEPDDGTLDAAGRPVGVGTIKESAPFRVDNNAPPTLTFDSGALAVNPDRQRGVPVPYRISDPEGDLVDVVFQWGTPDQPFPELDPSRLDEILADPRERRAHQICEAYRPPARSSMVPVDPVTVRVPAWTEGDFRAREPVGVGEELEVYRALRRVDSGEFIRDFHTLPWARRISLAQPIGDGMRAIAYDRETAEVLEIEVATGAVQRVLTVMDRTGGFEARLMEREIGEGAVLLALESPLAWRVVRVALADGAVRTLLERVEVDPALAQLASQGTGRACLAHGDLLTQIDYRGDVVTTRVLHDSGGLPIHGVAAHPAERRRLWFSVNDPGAGASGNLFVLELDRGRTTATGLFGLGTLAFEGNGKSLLVRGGFGIGIRELGRPGAQSGLSADVLAGQVGTSDEGLRLLVAPDGLLAQASGGLAQKRRIVSRDPLTGVVVVDTPFDPPLNPGDTVRLVRGRYFAPPGGRRRTFLWDAREVGPGSVLLRASVFDSDPGSRVGTEVLTPSGSFFSAEAQGIAASRPGVGDLDGDGDLDFVSGDGTVCFQVGRGRFDPVPLVLDLQGGTGLGAGVGDLDGDGDMDIAIGDGGRVLLYLQQGPGMFGPAPDGVVALPPPPFRPEPFYVVVADLDRDGRADVAVDGGTRGGPVVIWQDAGGVFQAADPLVIGKLPNIRGGFSVVDLDDDGDLDLVAPGRGGPHLWRQASPRTFESVSLGADPLQSCATAHAADFDRDGDLDVLSGGSLSGLLLQSDSGFSVPVPLPLLTFLAPADLNGDGLLDVFAQRGQLVQDEDGGFALRDEDQADGLPLDIDLDGHVDALGSMVRLSSRPGEFLGAPLELRFSGGSNVIAFEDLDEDGDLDIVHSLGRVTLQAVPGVWESAFRQVARLLPGASVFREELRDVDGDGRPDWVALRSDTQGLEVYLREAPLAFAETPITIGPTGLRDYELFDLDADGTLDVVGLDPQENVLLFRQSAPGVFEPAEPLLPPGATPVPQGMVVGDMNGDGLPDLAVGTFDSPEVRFFAGQPGGAFQSTPQLLDGAQDVSRLALLDLDGNGEQDLVVTTRRDQFSAEDAIRAFRRGVGGGLEPFADGPNGELVDLDGDGDLDLITQSGVHVQQPDLFVAGRRVFGPTQFLSGIQDHTAGDLDGDGDMDVAFLRFFSSSGSVELFVHDQVARCSFDPVPQELPPSGVRLDSSHEVRALDLDGDGDLDLVVTGSSDLTVWWGGR